MKRRQLLGTAAAMTSFIAGCTGDGGGDGGGIEAEETATPTAGGAEETTTLTADGAEKTIVMEETLFKPVTAAVDTGTTVTWVNRDGHDHDVTAAQFSDSAVEWSFDEPLSEDESISYTFGEKGVYEYYCTLHSKRLMCGAILVGGATPDESLPCDVGGG